MVALGYPEHPMTLSSPTRLIPTAEGYHFRVPLRVLRQAAEATHRMFDAEIVRLEASAARIAADEDAAPDGSRPDVDGPDLHDLLADALQAAEDAANEARKAFAIAAYHHWEHAIERRLREDHAAGKIDKVPRIAGKAMDKAATSFGWSVDPAIPRLRMLVNLLKHDSEERWRELQVSWPELYQPYLRWQTCSDSGFANSIRLDQVQLLEILDVVERSGPPFCRPATAEEVAWFDVQLEARLGAGAASP